MDGGVLECRYIRMEMGDANLSLQGGRYVRSKVLASGGMAVVYLGRLTADAGFSRTVAIKSLQEPFASDRNVVAMLVDEARLVARVQHPNVVPVLDVVNEGGRLHLVMEYVHGVPLSRLLDRGEPLAPEIAVGILIGALEGLHAAHEARDEKGRPLEIVHRDVSPQNILVGADGVARVLDFGIAKAAVRLQASRAGEIKGKIAYMAPEQLEQGEVDRRGDIYAAAIVLWEALTGQRLFQGDSLGALVGQALFSEVPRPSRHAPEVSERLDRLVLRGLAHAPEERFATAREMAEALEQAVLPASAREIAAEVQRLASDELERRQSIQREVEQGQGDVPAHLSQILQKSSPAGSDPGTPLPRGNTEPTRIIQGRGRLLGWLAVGGTLGGLALALARGTADAGTSAGAVNSAFSTPPSTAPSSMPSSPPQPPPTLASANAEPSLAVLPSELSARKPAPNASSPKPISAAARGLSNSTNRPLRPKECAVPFTINSQNIRIPKPECL